MAGIRRKKVGKAVNDASEAPHGRTLRGGSAPGSHRPAKRAAKTSGNGVLGPPQGPKRTRAPRRAPADASRVGGRGDETDRGIKQLEALCMRLERRAEAAERVLHDTVSTLSHDVRNHLSVIVVSARMLARSLPPEAAGRKQIEAINRAADDINQLAHDLVDAMSIEHGSLRIGKDPHDVEPIVDRALQIVAPTAALKPIEIAKELPSDLPPISGDRERLVQVLANLLGNAIRFTPKGGRVLVRADPLSRDARFSVSDTGPGIPAELVPWLFARSSPNRRPMGQGVGLSAFVTKGIVEAHGGTIWVESEPGRGSTFYFTIPQALHLSANAP